MKRCLLAIICIFPALAVQAMHRNSSGLGQVLIAPYYTVNGGHQTLISIGNRSDQGKALKLRFLEGMNGREVLQFNIYLAPNDLWTGALFSYTDSGPANLVTQDDSCSVPDIRNNVALPLLGNGLRYVPFTNFGYAFANNDAGPDELSRSREGYFEVIEMGEVINAAQRSLNDISPGSDGIPANCARIRSAWLPGGYWATNPEADMTPPKGGVSVAVSLVDVLNGSMYSYSAEAIDAFSSIVQHTPNSSVLPNLSSGVTNAADAYVEATVVVGGAPLTSRYPLSRGIDAVSALLMAETLHNEFSTSAASGARSAWIVSFPTKKFYTDDALVTNEPMAPFTRKFSQSTPDGGPYGFPSVGTFPDPCPSFEAIVPARGEAMYPKLFDRRQTYVLEHCAPYVGWNALLMGQFQVPSLNWASNVLRFSGSTFEPPGSLGLLGSTLAQTVDVYGVAGTTEGWMSLRFFDEPNPAELSAHVMRADSNGRRHVGLPLVGFAAVNFTNGQLLPGVLSNYATQHKHRTTVRVLEATP